MNKRAVVWLTVFLGAWAESLHGASVASARAPVVLCCDARIPQVQFAAGEIRRALATRGSSLIEVGPDALPQAAGGTRIILSASASESQRIAASLNVSGSKNASPQSYAIRKHTAGGQTTYAVLGADADGAMYGGLDLAEAIELGALAEIRDSDHAPYIARRGIKFNIPLDLRTPSYSDCSDSFQANIPEMWSVDFWSAFLDEMARRRFNVLTLWSLHPFPSLVKVPEYPDVALDDVWRTRAKLDDTFSHTGSDMVRPAMLEDVEVVKRMTIGEKIQFWRDVMQLAHDRGIEVYLFTWNIFVWGADGKHGITWSQTNPTTIDYFRASVRETVLTYPLLAGIGITAGEHMENRKDEFSKEKWLWKTYGEGIRDALRLQPGRAFRLIHRYHQTGQGEILREWKDYPGTFDFSFKYAIAHMYSTTNPPFIKPLLPSLPPDKRTWLTVRNDDIYSFRWGDPEFARAFIRAMPGADKMAGFYMGSDGYCWGREFIDKEPATPRQLVMQKQWYSFMLWGRLSYDPALPDALFERTLTARFPEAPGDKLLKAWAAASKVFPQITRFFWGDIDIRWFPEASLSHPKVRGFYSVRHFIEGNTMPESGILNIREWRERSIKQKSMDGVTPIQVAENLRGYARETLQLVGEVRPLQGKNKELRLTLGDLEAFAHVGNYYGEKILGAADLALFDVTANPQQQKSAVKRLEAARDHWIRYAAVAGSQYKPQLLNRAGYVDLNALTEKVERDIEMARDWKPGAVKRDAKTFSGADRPFAP
ncbi:carbohydrate-binding family 6 protein [Candidatus Sumerlaeota bacterium]|nr:carbohydrate-binding family 6 protein [Candidatus Sumerlaeota bacterium]